MILHRLFSIALTVLFSASLGGYIFQVYMIYSGRYPTGPAITLMDRSNHHCNTYRMPVKEKRFRPGYKIGVLPKTMRQVKVLGKQGPWLKIKHSGRNMWVLRGCVK